MDNYISHNSDIEMEFLASNNKTTSLNSEIEMEFPESDNGAISPTSNYKIVFLINKMAFSANEMTP